LSSTDLEVEKRGKNIIAGPKHILQQAVHFLDSESAGAPWDLGGKKQCLDSFSFNTFCRFGSTKLSARLYIVRNLGAKSSLQNAPSKKSDS